MLGPGGGPRPATRRHQITQHLANGRRLASRLRPGEIGEIFRPHGDKHEPRPQLRHPVVRGMQQPPVGRVAEFREPVENMLPVRREPRQRKPPHVLQQQRPRRHDTAKLNRPGEQVPFIGRAELLARDGERRARHPAGQQVDTGIVGGRPDRGAGDVPLRHLPVRPVAPQRGARVRIELDSQFMLEPGKLKPQRLPSRPSTDLHDLVLRHLTSPCRLASHLPA